MKKKRGKANKREGKRKNSRKVEKEEERRKVNTRKWKMKNHKDK